MIHNTLQGTEEWKLARVGYCTASRFKDVMTEARGKSEAMSKTAEAYLYELIGEHLTGKPADDYENYAMKWGTEHEPAARDAYVWHSGNNVREVGFTIHDDEELVGCSCDGLVGEFETLEIKCPLTPKAHVAVLISGRMPEEHMAQVQGQLWITGRAWCNFVSFHPLMKDKRHRLAVVKVQRDNDFIAEMAAKVVAFRNKILETLAKLNGEV